MQIIQKASLEDGKLNLGKVATVKLDDMTFGVVIKEARFRFGHLDYLIEPLNGAGRQWVEQHRVDIKG